MNHLLTQVGGQSRCVIETRQNRTVETSFKHHLTLSVQVAET